MGLARCSFIPASRAFLTSSEKASAVIAMIGNSSIPSRSKPRMALVASIYLPELGAYLLTLLFDNEHTGILQSLQLRLKVPFLHFLHLIQTISYVPLYSTLIKLPLGFW